jgi:hypothetical protein
VEAGCGSDGDSGGGAMAGLAGTVGSACWERDERPFSTAAPPCCPFGVTLGVAGSLCRVFLPRTWGWERPCPTSGDCPGPRGRGGPFPA